MSLILSIVIVVISIFGLLYTPDTIYGITNSENILLNFYFDPFMPFKNYGLTIFSSFFFHGDFTHLFSNIFLFYFSALYFEKCLNKLKLLIFILFSQMLILAWVVITHSQFDMTIANYYLGPSGVIFALIYFDLIAYKKFLAAGFFSLSIIMDYYGYFPLFNSGRTAHQSHLAGILIGVTFGVIYYLYESKKSNVNKSAVS